MDCSEDTSVKSFLFNREKSNIFLFNNQKYYIRLYKTKQLTWIYNPIEDAFTWHNKNKANSWHVSGSQFSLSLLYLISPIATKSNQVDIENPEFELNLSMLAIVGQVIEGYMKLLTLITLGSDSWTLPMVNINPYWWDESMWVRLKFRCE